MTKLTKLPDELNFRLHGFDWTIKFLDVESENFGLTFSDKKEIHIYTKGHSRQNVMETLLHELQHALLMDAAHSIFHYDVESVHAKEENLIRISSPRVFQLIRDNIELCEFILKEMKRL